MMDLSEQYEVVNRFSKRAPVDVEGLSEALGVDVRYAYLDRDIAGMIEKGNGRYLITINAYDPPTRQRFTLAHELGHYMLHRHLIGDGLDDDRAYRSTGVGKFHNTKVGPRQETEANRFAANVLMPRALIEELRSKGVVDPREVARALGVSEHAASIRLGIPYQAGWF